MQQICNMAVTVKILTKKYNNDNILLIKATTWTCPYCQRPTESFWLVEKSGDAAGVPP
jgi:hypothetical protein